MPDEATLLWWGTGLSIVALAATAIGVPWIVARLPRDYFSKPRRTVWRAGHQRPVLAAALTVGKNLLGVVLVVLGVVMLVTPGQGLLTLFVGAFLTNFPGKYRLERWLLHRPGVFKALNWIRSRRGQPPFDAPGGAAP